MFSKNKKKNKAYLSKYDLDKIVKTISEELESTIEANKAMKAAISELAQKVRVLESDMNRCENIIKNILKNEK